MIIEIQRFENFYWVRHRQTGVIGDTVVELADYDHLYTYIDALLRIVKHQMLEEVVIMKEMEHETLHFITRSSGANDIIPNLKDPNNIANEAYTDLEKAAKGTTTTFADKAKK